MSTLWRQSLHPPSQLSNIFTFCQAISISLQQPSEVAPPLHQQTCTFEMSEEAVIFSHIFADDGLNAASGMVDY